MTGALNFLGQSPLVLGASPSLAAGADFARVGDKALQHVDLLVIQFIGFISTKWTFLWGGKEAAPTLLSFG